MYILHKVSFYHIYMDMVWGYSSVSETEDIKISSDDMEPIFQVLTRIK